MLRRSLVLAAAFIAQVNGAVFFTEKFNDDDWQKRWTIPTKWKSSSDLGSWKRTAGEYHGPDESDTGILTETDMRFYGLSAPLEAEFNNMGQDLIIQYTVKYEKKQDCGGAYIKLMNEGSKFNANSFGGDTPYVIMFGPDVCGGNKRTHVILHGEKKNENVLITKDVPCETDSLSHMYRLHIKSDNTFQVSIDGKVVREGALEDEFELLAPKKIKDPTKSKPEDWVDNAQIDDPNDVKPEGWDDIEPEIVDPDASRPDDWDDDEDGEWEAPIIPNPEYKGPWYPKRIPNPDYKGPWEHPMIDNEDYEPDDELYAVCGKKACSHVGFELWTVSSGTMFDDIIITNDLAEATSFATETFFAKKDNEKLMYEDDNSASDMDDAGFNMDDLDFDIGDMGMEDFGDEL